jgi:23S rRNA (cytosine1962-C5)-methyltransferase
VNLQSEDGPGQSPLPQLLPVADLPQLIQTAWLRRALLHTASGQDTYRIFHGFSEGLPGLNIDRYAAAALISHPAECHYDLAVITTALLNCHLFDLVVSRPQKEPAKVLHGTIPAIPLEVLDNNTMFHIEPLAANPGLYLDARPARTWLQEHSENRRILNLFAHTGSLGLAASMGHARSVIHIDTQKRSLRRIRSNYQLNALRIDDRDLVCQNVFTYLRQSSAQFDGIILDPPPRLPRLSQHTTKDQNFQSLIPAVLENLAPGGWLLCFFHRNAPNYLSSPADIQELTSQPLSTLWTATSGDDFPEADPQAKLRFAAYRAVAPAL